MKEVKKAISVKRFASSSRHMLDDVIEGVTPKIDLVFSQDEEIRADIMAQYTTGTEKYIARGFQAAPSHIYPMGIKIPANMGFAEHYPVICKTRYMAKKVSQSICDYLSGSIDMSKCKCLFIEYKEGQPQPVIIGEEALLKQVLKAMKLVDAQKNKPIYIAEYELDLRQRA